MMIMIQLTHTLLYFIIDSFSLYSQVHVGIDQVEDACRKETSILISMHTFTKRA